MLDNCPDESNWAQPTCPPREEKVGMPLALYEEADKLMKGGKPPDDRATRLLRAQARAALAKKKDGKK